MADDARSQSHAAAPTIGLYAVLGLTEAASSEDIDRSLLVERWPWHLADEESRRDVTALRLEAVGVLSNPRRRATYDTEQGYSVHHLARRIGKDSSIWGQTWLVAFCILALLIFVGGPNHAARAFGGMLAPDFQEISVSVQPESGCVQGLTCQAYQELDFRSSSGLWHWFLNSWWVWLLPSAVAVLTGMMLRTAVSRASGYAVAAWRLAGHRDAAPRFIMLVLWSMIPVGILLAYWLAPPAGISLPSANAP
jgi:hypothetical protein